MAGSTAEEGQGAVDIDEVVVKRDLAGLADSLEGGKVDDGVDGGVFGKDLVQGGLVGDVEVVVGRSSATDELNAIEDLFGRVAQVVDNDHVVAGFEEGEGGETANIACATERGEDMSVSLEKTVCGGLPSDEGGSHGHGVGFLLWWRDEGGVELVGFSRMNRGEGVNECACACACAVREGKGEREGGGIR